MHSHLSHWPEIQVYLATARHRSLVSVAARLGIDHSTAFRRLKSLERRIGSQLFERGPTGYVLTTLGEDLLPLAEQVEQSILALDRRIAAQDRLPSGPVRISVPDSLAAGYFAPRLERLQRRLPAIVLDFCVDNLFADLARREADIAVRPTPRPEGDLVGRRAARMAYALYASDAYVARFGEPSTPKALRAHRICGFGEAVRFFTAARWLSANADTAAVSVRFDSTTAMAAAARSGQLIAALPCFIGDTEPMLRRLIGPSEGLSVDIWLLTHADLRRVPRIRVVLDTLFDMMTADRTLLEGDNEGFRPASA